MSDRISNIENSPQLPMPGAKRVPSWLAYASSAVLVTATLLARLAMGFGSGEPPALILFLIPIIISAYLGGVGPGLLSTALSAIAVNYFFMGPVYSFSIPSGIYRTTWVVFIVAGTLVSVLTEWLHRSKRTAEATLTELKRVQEALRKQEQILAEERLRQSEHQLEIALRAARMVSFIWDPLDDVMRISGDFMEIFGRPPITRSEEGFELVHPDDRQRHRAGVERAASEGGAYVMEFRIIRPDNGSIVWIEDRGDVLLDEAGRLKLIAGTAVDVTRRKQMEEELRGSEEKFSVIYDKAAFAIALARLPDGVIVDVNDAWVEMYGYTKEEATGRTSLALGINRNPEEWPRLFSDLLQRGSVRDMEATFFTKSGAARMISCNIDVVALGGEEYLLSTMHDVTVKKRAEEVLRRSRAELERLVAERTSELSMTYQKLLAEVEVRRKVEESLQHSEEQLRLATEGAEIGVWDWDILNNQVYWSKMCKALFGVPDGQELTYAIFEARVHPEDRAEVNKKVAAAMAERVDFIHEYRVIRPDGALRWIASRGGVRYDQERRPVRLIGVVIDITERKGSEKALADYARRLEDLSGRLLHAQETERRRIARELHDEIGQSLTAIRMQLHAIHRRSNTDLSELQECLQTVDHALREVQNLSLNLHPSQLDELGLPEALQWHLDRRAKTSNLISRFSSDILPAPRLNPHLETACFRVAQEALTNVIRHANAREVSIELTQRGAELHLIIQDDGKGFDVEASRDRALQGSSLGLIGMQERVELVGGRLEWGSIPGRGTRVHAVFPLVNTPPRARPRRTKS